MRFFLPYIHISRMRKRMSLHNIRDVYVYIYISKNCYAVDVFLLMPFVDCVCVYFGVTRTYFHVLYSHFVSFSHPHTKHAVITYTFHKFMYIQCQIIKLLHRFAYVLGIRKKKKKERRIFYSENRWRVKRHAKQMWMKKEIKTAATAAAAVALAAIATTLPTITIRRYGEE